PARPRPPGTRACRNGPPPPGGPRRPAVHGGVRHALHPAARRQRLAPGRPPAGVAHPPRRPRCRPAPQHPGHPERRPPARNTTPELADGNHLGTDVVLHVGTNGTIQPSALDAVLARMGSRRVVLVSVHVPRPWQDLNNRILTEAVHNHPNVHLVDWNAAASAHPEWLWPDGIHLRPEGAAAYRDLIEGALK